ncbi:MAG: efflux RND transporter periplasmic adaptor subunit [Acidobacteriota bacterium]
MQFKRKHKLIGGGLIVAAGLLTFLFYPSTNAKGKAPTFLTAPVKKGTVRRTVSSTGTLEAVVTVQVGSQVSGRIQELDADYNSVVKKGQVLAILDPANYAAQRDRSRASLTTAKANLQNAEATILNRQAEVKSSLANVDSAKVDASLTERQYKRQQELFEEKLITQQDVEDARAAMEQSQARLKQAEAQVDQSQAALASARAQKDQAAASIRQAEAELKIAEVNLQYTTVTSPIDGVVIERNVDIGQTVAATLQAPTLFLIANDLSHMRLIAQVDEADIGGISEQATVNFTVDAFPDEVFKGTISEIRLGSSKSTAGTASNVVVYNVIVDVANPELKLRPGMTATAEFTVANARDVLTIPNTALRFTPSTLAAEKTSPRQEVADPPQNPTEEVVGSGPVVRTSGTEQYGIKAGPKVHFPSARPSEPTWGEVWVLAKGGDSTPQPRRVQLGITDGVETAILGGQLNLGDRIILREFSESEGSRISFSPFGGPPRRRG